MRDLRQLANSPIAMLAARLAVAALGLVSAPIIARALGPTGRGETSAVLTALFLIPIVLALGMPYEVRRRMSDDGREATVRAARLVCLAMTIPAALAGFALTSTLFSSLEPAAMTATLAGFAASPVMISWMCDTGVLVAQRRLGAVAIMQCTQPLVFVVGLVIVWALGYISVASVVWCSIAGSVATAALGLVLNPVSVRGQMTSPPALVRSSIPFLGTHAIDAGYRRIDQLIMLPILGAHQAGIYSVAVTVATIPIFVAQALAARVFADVAQSEPQSVERVSGEVVRSAVVAGLTSAFALALAAPLLIDVVFGPAFAPALVPAWIAIAASVPTVVSVTLVELISTNRRGWQLSAVMAAGMVTVVALLLAFGGKGGAVAASTASASAAVVVIIGLLAIARIPMRHLVPRPSDLTRTARRLVRQSD